MTTDEMAVKLAETEARSKSNTHRLDALEGQIDAVNRLATAVEVMATEQKHQTETIKEIKADVTSLDGKVEAIEQKPARKWEGLAEKVLWALVAAAITFILSRIGMS
ncbi:MAG: hypothetical protein IJR65_06095 [Oscillospiraceae bacterium]|nr:hypothetical protein [Oscillospiraceae bacterium]